MCEAGAVPRQSALDKLSPSRTGGGSRSWMSKPHRQAAVATGNKKVPPLSRSERLGKLCPWPEQNRQTAAERDSFNYSKRNSKENECFLQADCGEMLPGTE